MLVVGDVVAVHEEAVEVVDVELAPLEARLGSLLLEDCLEEVAVQHLLTDQHGLALFFFHVYLDPVVDISSLGTPLVH